MTEEAYVIISEDPRGGIAVHFQGPDDARVTRIAAHMYGLLKEDLEKHDINYDDSGERIENE